MYTLEIKLNECVDEEIRNYYTNLASSMGTVGSLVNQTQSHSDQRCLSTDSGVDIVTTEDYYVEPNKKCTINHNIRCQMVDEEGNFQPYYLYPRSSISKTPLVLLNSVGIIDMDYRGDLMAKVRNIPESNDDGIYHIKKGTRLFQICARDLSPLNVRIVDELTETNRGTGGFGSTGSGI